MKIYRDQVVRVSMAAMRAAYRPRDYAKLDTLALDAAGISTTVRIVKEPSAGAFGGTRRWAVCPRCGKRTSVIGLVVRDEGATPVWSCARANCGAWKSRKRLKLRRSLRGERKDPP